jgi:chromosome segregation ATPase
MSIINIMQAAAYPSFPQNEVHAMSDGTEILDTLPVVQSSVPPTTLTESEMRTFFDRLSTNFFSLSQQAQQLSDAIGAIEMLKAEVTGLKSDNRSLHAQAEGLQNRCTLLEVEVEETTKLAETYAKERYEALVKVDLQQIEIHDLRAQVEHWQGQAESWKIEAEDYNNESMVAKEQARSLTDERNEAVRKAKAISEQNERQEQTIKAQVESMGQLQTTLQLARHDVDRAQKAKVDADTEVESLKAEIEALTAQRDGAHQKLSDIGNILRTYPSSLAAA